jgi:hypothetical protein
MAAKTASLSVNIIADAAKAKSGLKEAEGAFGKFKNSVGDANGAMGKFKAGATGALDYVKANALNFAAAAGAAVVAFGVKSVNAFQDLALSAGKFADATGMAVDDASRFIEVAGDIGIEAATLEKSLGFMNKALGNSPDLFKNLGIEIEYTNGGAKDASATFLNVIDRIKGIKDPAEKAAVASQLLGRGWQQMAELIETGSGSLKKSLAEVSEQKVITPEELQKARDFRAALDNLNDRFEDISLTVGGKVVPALTNAIDSMLGFVDAAMEIPGISLALKTLFNPGVTDSGSPATLAGGIEMVVNKLFGLKEETKETTVVTDEMARVWIEGYRAMIDAVPPAQNLTSEIDRQKQMLEEAKYAWDLFKGNLSMELERQGLVSDIEAFRVKWADSTSEAKRNSEEYRAELLRLQIQVANFGGETIRTATIATQNKIRVLVETGQLERAVQLLQYIRNNTLGYVQTPTATYAVTPYGAMPARAGGGIITKPEVSMVGEAGAEAIIPLTNPTRAMELMQASGLDMLAMSGMGGGGGGGTTIVVNVQAGLVSSPDQVGQQIIEAIRRAERRSGQVFAAA